MVSPKTLRRLEEKGAPGLQPSAQLWVTRWQWCLADPSSPTCLCFCCTGSLPPTQEDEGGEDASWGVWVGRSSK